MFSNLGLSNLIVIMEGKKVYPVNYHKDFVLQVFKDVLDWVIREIFQWPKIIKDGAHAKKCGS
jgi:hypothetical protein